jgi:hypothetical protein
MLQSVPEWRNPYDILCDCVCFLDHAPKPLSKDFVDLEVIAVPPMFDVHLKPQIWSIQSFSESGLRANQRTDQVVWPDTDTVTSRHSLTGRQLNEQH